MIDFADRVLLSLAAFLMVAANELRLFQTRPETAEGAFTTPSAMRLFDDAHTIYLSTPDIWLRSILAAAAIAFSGWVFTTAFRKA